MTADILGYTSSGILLFTIANQVHKQWQSGTSKGVSTWLFIGQLLASLLMIAGYAIIAVPTGIVSAELVLTHDHPPVTTRTCPHCAAEGHEPDARYCKRCGGELAPAA